MVQKIDATALSNGSRALSNGHTEITTQLNTVTTAVRALEAEWDGKTKDAFEVFYKNYKTAMEAALVGLTDMSSFLTTYSVDADEMDTRHAGRLQS